MRYWICKCGSINDDNMDILCRNCNQSALSSLYGIVQFASEEKMEKWIKITRKYMGAKVFRKRGINNG